ncbi:rod-binding protein [Neorhizobium alkalisoli]|uniref:Rod binding protein n=1 Tax=Neorhizobium alkalisoli TaxID=528178 RepID=A0A561QSY1_9HYPH|nr:rod-binding protein [Neorhizobium alkalisoli]TWF53386.1 rod binding protein [Neorhizobium alkalisoli]
MAISPPSDLVLDVVRNADPMALQEAQDKLKASKAAFAAHSLADSGKGFGAAVDMMSSTSASSRAGLDHAEKSKKTAEMPEEYRKFEASILSTFVNNMMPKETEDVYGKGSAGEFWKGMMAEKISDEMSKRGGVGIAEQMYSQALAKAKNHVTVNAATDENDRSQALSAVTDFQRKVLDVAQSDKTETGVMKSAKSDT